MTPLGYAALSLYAGEFAVNHEGYVLDSHQHRNEPITEHLLEWAFTQGHSISGYTALCTPEGVVTTVGALDLDEGTLDDGRAIRALLASHHIPSLLVESRRGCHLWTFHHGDGTHGSERYQPVPAGVVNKAMESAAKLAGYEGPKVEVFPRRSDSPWGVGALRMPLMPHPKTGEKYPAYTMEDEPITRVVDLINAIADMTAPYARVYALSGVEEAPVAYPSSLGVYARPRADADGLGVTAQLATLGVQAQPGRAANCPWHDDRHKSLSVAKDDERVFCKSPSCPAYNGGRGIGSLALKAMLEKEARG